MLADLFHSMEAALSGSPAIALAAAFAWGVCSVALSPCHLASIPLLIAYINGRPASSPRRAAWLSTLFALGILATMAFVGLLTTWAGRLAGDTGPVAGWMVAAVFIAIGLHLMGILTIPWIHGRKEQVETRGAAGALLLGLLFGMASGPCTFAFMAPVLALVFRTASCGVALGGAMLTAYAAGHCTVLIAAGTSTEGARRLADWNRDTGTARRAKTALGLLLVLAGLYFIYKTA